jgi:hypothetical protein
LSFARKQLKNDLSAPTPDAAASQTVELDSYDDNDFRQLGNVFVDRSVRAGAAML